MAEAGALLDYAERLGTEFVEALQIIHDSAGPLIVAGIGKSGHIAKKIASTLSSIGKPSVFVHAAEASHGDLGLIQANSAVLILSNSGETSELSDLRSEEHTSELQSLMSISYDVFCLTKKKT